MFGAWAWGVWLKLSVTSTTCGYVPCFLFHSSSFIIKYLHKHTHIYRTHTWSDKFNIEWVCHKQTVKNGNGNGNSE